MPRSSKSRRTTVKSSPSQNEVQEQGGGDGGGEGSSSELTFGQKSLLQRLTAAGSLSASEMSEVYLQIKKDFSMGVPSSPEGELQSEIKKCVGKINALLSPASFSISLHHSPPETHYVFHNVLADAIAIKYGSNMSIEEFGLFKAALESIVSETAAAAASKSKDDDDDDDDDDNSDDEAQNPSSSSGSSSGISKGKFISLRTSETATATVDNNANSENSASGENTTNSSSTSPKKAKPLTANKAEKLFQRLLNEKWLVEGNKKVTIGSRAWVEMGEMIRSMGAEGGGQVVTLR